MWDMIKRARKRFSDDDIVDKIYYIRKQKVMLDRDLAELYGVKPIRLREQVKRNAGKFPPHFMFRLTRKEADVMVSQNAIPSSRHFGGYLPYAFTEHGILMLANVLKSKTATSLSVRIIEIFVKMREMLSAHKEILFRVQELERRTADQDKEIRAIFTVLKKLLHQPASPRRLIGFKVGDNKEQ